MTEIQTLWRAGRLPIEDGVFFADGRSYAVDVEGTSLAVVEELDLAQVLAEDPDWVTSIDVTRTVPAPAGFVCAGEGSHGSEGFFARLDADRELVWVCYLSECNPFDGLTVTGTSLTATSTSGITITVDLDAPVG
ncbi:hypothetical protein [Alloactinosynnema sp. L-07]|uniref:hypothetical protein n=1 Tax=Alloactinosynnema sp. L-07 TaxID=1653480 RepID=UPI00065F03A7|nr:hypothetical protein [Alloactinosynnema sp. L-07]CRK58286.1 hypothetical protein [Alloactinosynnema sp. L-07]